MLVAATAPNHVGGSVVSEHHESSEVVWWRRCHQHVLPASSPGRECHPNTYTCFPDAAASATGSRRQGGSRRRLPATMDDQHVHRRRCQLMLQGSVYGWSVAHVPQEASPLLILAPYTGPCCRQAARPRLHLHLQLCHIPSPSGARWGAVAVGAPAPSRARAAGPGWVPAVAGGCNHAASSVVQPGSTLKSIIGN